MTFNLDQSNDRKVEHFAASKGKMPLSAAYGAAVRGYWKTAASRVALVGRLGDGGLFFSKKTEARSDERLFDSTGDCALFAQDGHDDLFDDQGYDHLFDGIEDERLGVPSWG